ncbi:MAG: hypothetical protein EAY75_12100 [Bacteroidetes bacterium]|nr:MAG: hypothetical protein EAY75_12100 [Bacteroidota bacterium]
MLNSEYSIFYIITIALQVVCAIHCVKKGTQQKWIWLIVFLPVAGSLVYLFSEVFTRRDLQHVQLGVGAVLNPSGTIKKLEERLAFADTFQNRMLLADAELAAGHTKKAIARYESSLAGNFSENEHVLLQLCLAYSATEQWEKAVHVGRKVYKTPQFLRSKVHIAFAQALAQYGQLDEAEVEFRKMGGRYANFEARYQYGIFLAQQNRLAEAKQLWQQLTEEDKHLSGTQKRENRAWTQMAKTALQKI